MVLKTDAIPGGTVTKWEWYAAMGTGTQLHADLNNFTLKLCSTSLSHLTTPFSANYDGHTPTTVYSAAVERVSAPAQTWFGFTFQTPFAYAGTENLLVEVRWEGGTDGGPYCYMSEIAGCQRNVWASVMNGNPVNGYPDVGAVYDYSFRMRITIEDAPAVSPASLGRLKALLR